VAHRLANRGGLARGGVNTMERLFAAGAVFSSAVTVDALSFRVRMRPDRLEEVLRIAAEQAWDPASGIEDADVELAREHLAQRIEDDEEQRPARLAALAARVLGGTRYARAPSPASVRAVSGDDLRGWLREAMRPERAVVVVVAARRAEESVHLVRKAFGDGDFASPVGAVAAGRAPAPPASVDTALLEVDGRGERAELWLAWGLPGKRDHTSAQGIAAAALVKQALLGRARRENLRVRWLAAWHEEHENASLLVARAWLEDKARPDEVRRELVEAAAEVSHDREPWKVLRATRLGQDLTYQAFERLEAGHVDGVPELVRATGQPDALTDWNRQAGVMPAQLQAFLARHVRADQAAALLVRKSTAPKTPEVPDEFVRSWGRATSLLSTSAPGAGEVARLVAPPRFDGGIRRTLPNGLEVVLLPRGSYPTVAASLFVRGDTDSPVGRSEKISALFGAMLDLRERCGVELPETVGGGVRIGRHVPAARLAATLQELACWTKADPNRWQVDALLEAMKREEKRPGHRAGLLLAGLQAALSAPPGPLQTLEMPSARLGRAEVARRFRRWFRPENATLVIAGKIAEPQAVMNDVLELFGSWHGDAEPLEEPPAPPTGARRVLFVDFPGSTSAWSLVFLRLPPPGERDEAAVRVLRAQLEGRLTELVVPVEGEGAVGVHGGPHLAFASVGFLGRRGQLPAMLEAVLTDLRLLGERPLPPAALDYARWRAAIDAAYEHDDLDGVVGKLGALALQRQAPSTAEGFGAALGAVTPASLHALAGAVVGRELVVVAGDAKSLLPELKKLGLEPQVIPWKTTD